MREKDEMFVVWARDYRNFDMRRKRERVIRMVFIDDYVLLGTGISESGNSAS